MENRSKMKNVVYGINSRSYTVVKKIRELKNNQKELHKMKQTPEYFS